MHLIISWSLVALEKKTQLFMWIVTGVAWQTSGLPEGFARFPYLHLPNRRAAAVFYRLRCVSFSVQGPIVTPHLLYFFREKIVLYIEQFVNQVNILCIIMRTWRQQDFLYFNHTVDFCKTIGNSSQLCHTHYGTYNSLPPKKQPCGYMPALCLGMHSG